MPARNDAQIKADNATEAAVDQLRHAYNRASAKEGSTLTSYVVVAESILIDSDGEISDEWTDIFTNHGERLSTAKGLLVLGAENIVKDNDDDE